MKLYLVRHGDARSKEEDPQRPLSDDGVRDVTNIARFLTDGANANPAQVYHSPKLRARQTAEILVKTAALSAPMSETDELEPLAEIGPLAEKLLAVDADRMLVGHLPQLARLTSRLLCGQPEPEVVEFAAGGALCLNREGGDGSIVWRLEGLVSPGLARIFPL